MGKEYKKDYEHIFVCVEQNHFAVHLKLTHCKSTTFQ